MVLRYRPWESRAPLTGGRRFPFLPGRRGGAAGGTRGAPFFVFGDGTSSLFIEPFFFAALPR